MTAEQAFRPGPVYDFTDPRLCAFGATDGIASPTCVLLCDHEPPHRAADGRAFA